MFISLKNFLLLYHFTNKICYVYSKTFLLYFSEINYIHQEHDDASKDLEGYLNNPINAYRLIKRLYTDWPTFEESVTVEATRTSEFWFNR